MGPTPYQCSHCTPSHSVTPWQGRLLTGPLPQRVVRLALACWCAHRWWAWGFCCHPWQSSCSQSTMCPQDHQTQSTSHPAFHLIEKENIKFYGTSWFKGHPSLLRLQCNFLCHTDLWICTLFCSSHVNFKCNTVIPTNTNTTHTRKKQCEAAAHCDSYLISMYVITLLVLPCLTNTDHYADSHESHATQTQNRHAGLHTHTCTHVHTHTHIHTNMCAHMNMHTHTHMNTHCVCVCVCRIKHQTMI